MNYFCCVLLVCASLSVNAELRVVTEDWPPFNYVDNRGRIIGNATEMVEKVLKKAGIEYKIEVYPWARSYQMAQEQPNVLLFSILKTSQREHLFDWFCPIHQPISMYFYRLTRNDKVVLQTIEDAKKYRVGVPRGDWNEYFLVSLGFERGKNLDVTANNEINLQTLIAGRIDMILDAEDAVYKRLNKLGFNTGTVTRAFEYDVLPEEEVCMVLSKNTDEELKQKIEHAFKQVVLHNNTKKSAY